MTMALKSGMRPVHPGEVLREEYLVPLGMSAHALSKALHLTPSRVNDIVLGDRGITADTAMRLARYGPRNAQSRRVVRFVRSSRGKRQRSRSLESRLSLLL
jgi:antitoxin HigA-1